MFDPTESARRERLTEINSEPGSRKALEAQYGQVWSTSELTQDYEVLGFAAPLVVVRRKSDGVQGLPGVPTSASFLFQFHGWLIREDHGRECLVTWAFPPVPLETRMRTGSDKKGRPKPAPEIPVFSSIQVETSQRQKGFTLLRLLDGASERRTVTSQYPPEMPQRTIEYTAFLRDEPVTGHAKTTLYIPRLADNGKAHGTLPPREQQIPGSRLPTARPGAVGHRPRRTGGVVPRQVQWQDHAPSRHGTLARRSPSGQSGPDRGMASGSTGKNHQGAVPTIRRVDRAEGGLGVVEGWLLTCLSCWSAPCPYPRLGRRV